MTGQPQPSSPPTGSKRLTWGVFAIVLFATAQLSWWAVFHLRYSAQEIRATAEHLESERRSAEKALAAMASHHTGGLEGPVSFLQEAYPQLDWRPGAHPGRELVTGFPGYGVVARLDQVERLQARHRAAVRMFICEGATFLAILLTGATLILRSARREMRLLRQQANFLSAVTHELKSPLASLKLFIETLEMRDLSQEKKARYLGHMQDDVARLEDLVGNVLTVARLDAGRFIMRKGRRDIVHEVSEVVHSLQDELAQRHLTIDLALPDEAIEASYDSWVLTTVLRNVLDNAAKYGGPAPRARVAVLRTPTAAQLEIVDSGIGLAAPDRERVFERFYRVGDEMVRQTKGTGLGLYLARELMHQSGGEITAHSAGLGQGTTFRITFPLLGVEEA